MDLETGRVLVVGSLNEDLVVRARRLPGAGETVMGMDITRGTGGKGANQAVAAVLAGARVTMVGFIGRDRAGERIKANLDRAGVDVSHVLLATDESGSAVVIVDEQGANQIVVVPGANRNATEDTVSDLRRYGMASVVLAQGELAPATLRALGRSAAGDGRRFVLNMAPVGPDLDFPRNADPLIVNQFEALELLGGRGRGEAFAHPELAEAVGLAFGCSTIVTLGAAGAAVFAEGSLHEISAPRVASPVDTTGAGDAFVGTVAALLAQEIDLVSAARVGVYAGALAVARRGTLESFAELPAVLSSMVSDGVAIPQGLPITFDNGEGIHRAN